MMIFDSFSIDFNLYLKIDIKVLLFIFISVLTVVLNLFKDYSDNVLNKLNERLVTYFEEDINLRTYREKS